MGASATRSTSLAFFYSDGQMTDLNNSIDPALGIMLTGANGINDNGQIVARGYYKDTEGVPSLVEG